MNNSTKIIISLVLVVVVAVGAVVMFKDSDSTEKKDADTSQPTDEPAGESADEAATVTVTYDGTSFTPAEITVASGDTIKIVNNGEDTVEPASDPHPTHTTNSELNAGDIEPGDSKTFTVTTQGTWGYHNHYSPSEKGTIIVE
jgi:plastocyanin